MINILICDDSEYWLSNNEKLVQECINNIVDYTIHKFTDPKYIKQDLFRSIDIAILDIELQNETGLELAEKILRANEDISIIFVTGYDTFTKEAYSICADGYLTKPVNKVILEKLLRKAITYRLGLDKQQAVIEFYSDRNKVIIKQKNIMYIERVGRKVIIFAMQKKYDTIKTLSELEKELESFFVKVNQGTIVNMYEITNIENAHVYLANGTSFKLTRGCMKHVKEKYINFKNK